ncbi:MAG TPA: hypothetical protein VGJ05_20665 [Fimbriiglobus sp.]|jgi:hypothetical protein
MLVWFAPTIIARTELRNRFLASALQDLNGTLTADDASFGWFSHVELRGILLKDKDGKEVGRAEAITATERTLLDLLIDAKSIGNIRVTKPVIDLVCGSDATNVEGVFARYFAPSPSPSPNRISMKLQILDGTLIVQNPDGSVLRTLPDVAGEIDIPAARTDPVKVTAKSAPQTPEELAFNADFGESNMVIIVGKRIPLDAVGLFVKWFESTTALNGTLSTDLTVAWSKGSFSVNGTSTATNFELAGRWFGKDRLRFDKIELPAKFTVTGNTFAADGLRLACDAGSVSLNGSIDWTNAAVARNPGIKVYADLNLTKLATVLPHLFRLRPGTELSGGQLKISIGGSAGTAGTVWSGELSTSSIRAVRDGKPVTWDQPLRAGFAARLGADDWPVFDKLEIQSDFIGLAARGSAGSFVSAATIDMSKLAARIREFVDLDGLRLEGLAEVKLNSKSAPGGGFVVDAKATLSNFALAGADGVGLHEPELDLTLVARVKRASGRVGIDSGKLTIIAKGDSAEVSLTEPIGDITKLSSGRVTVAAAGDLTHWQDRLRPIIALSQDLATSGKGKLTGSMAFQRGKLGFDGMLNLEKFVVGPPAKPTWVEPTLSLAAKGELDVPGDSVRFDQLKIERDGLSAEAKGTVIDMSRTQDVQFDGTIAYDLAKLEPKLREFLGKGATVTGSDSRPFQLAGKLNGPGATLNVGTRADRRDPIASLTGSAVVGWRSLKAYGFDVGPADLHATLASSVVTVSLVAANFGGGQVHVTPRLTLRPDAYELSIAKGKVIDRAKLTPAICADALGYVLPAIANAAKAEGLVSFDLTECRVPLDDPTKAAMKGTLTLHEVKVGPGPVAKEIAGLLGATDVTLTLANEQPVGVHIEGGRVYHDNLSIDVRGYAVKTNGSVGFDGTLNLVVDLPLPSKLIDSAIGNRPILKDALAKKRIRVTLGGTLAQPRVDQKAFQASVQTLIRDAVKTAADEALKKGLKNLFPFKK